MSLIAHWALIIGGILLLMALIGSLVERLPVTPAMIYLAAGYVLGPAVLGLHRLDAKADAAFIQIMAEISVAFSLFAVGMRLRTPFAESTWRIPLRLALPAMVLTIAILSGAAMLICGMSFAAALVLGGVLAPTDPVLASEIRAHRLDDRDNVRFGLTAEGGMNDGLAAPAVQLGLGLAGLHELGDAGWRWFAVDVVWQISSGIAIGWIAGAAIGRIVAHLRSTYLLAIGFEEFLCIGVIALTYGGAMLSGASGFLAVFFAGLSMRHFERGVSLPAGIQPERVSINDDAAQTSPTAAPAHMAQTLSAFNLHAERIGEFSMMMLIGGLLMQVSIDWQTIAMTLVLLAIARPIAVWVTLRGSEAAPNQKYLTAWLGLRGVGSLYYLAFVLQSGIDYETQRQLISIVLTAIAASTVIHGITVTPLMRGYGRGKKNSEHDASNQSRKN